MAVKGERVEQMEETVKSNREYDQLYYTWTPDGISLYKKEGGMGIAASSKEDSAFRKICERIPVNRKPELTDFQEETEYFQYNASLKTYTFTGIYTIPSPEEIRNRDNWLAHILVPTDPLDLEDPSDYIRDVHYRPHIEKMEKGMERLDKAAFPPCHFSYQELLRKYNLTDCSRLAVLLSMEYGGFFSDGKKTIVFPLEVKPDRAAENRGIFSRVAREITWLLHGWVPEGLTKSREELCQNLGYATGRTARNKNCLCFIPAGDPVERDKQCFELDPACDYHDYQTRISRGADLFYMLAQKAQVSAEEVRGFVKEICGILPVPAGNIRQLQEAYQCYEMKYLLDEDSLPDWKEAGMDSKLSQASRGDFLARTYCMDYLLRMDAASRTLASSQLRQCWQVLASEGNHLNPRFESLVPVFLNTSYQLWETAKESQKESYKKDYFSQLELVRTGSSELKEKLYQDQNGCVQKHLARLKDQPSFGETEKNRTNQAQKQLEIFEDCLEAYGELLDDIASFAHEMSAWAETFYQQHTDQPKLESRLDQLVRTHTRVFDPKWWELLVLRTLPADSLSFYEAYPRTKTVGAEGFWLEKATSFLETCRFPGLAAYERFVRLSFEEKNLTETGFSRAVKNWAEKGRRALFDLKEKKKKGKGTNSSSLYCWFLYEKEQAGSWNAQPLWKEITTDCFEKLRSLKTDSAEDAGVQNIWKKMLRAEGAGAARLRLYLDFRAGKPISLKDTRLVAADPGSEREALRDLLWKETEKQREDVFPGASDSNHLCSLMRLEAACADTVSAYCRAFYDLLTKGATDEMPETSSKAQIARKRLYEIKAQGLLSEDDDIRQVTERVGQYTDLREYLDERESAPTLDLQQLKQYVSGYQAGVLESERCSLFEEKLVAEAGAFYEKQPLSVKKEINLCMNALSLWKNWLDQRYDCGNLEEFLNLSPELEEESPERWEQEHQKFQKLLARYDQILEQRAKRKQQEASYRNRTEPKAGYSSRYAAEPEPGYSTGYVAKPKSGRSSGYGKESESGYFPRYSGSPESGYSGGYSAKPKSGCSGWYHTEPESERDCGQPGYKKRRETSDFRTQETTDGSGEKTSSRGSDIENIIGFLNKAGKKDAEG